MKKPETSISDMKMGVNEDVEAKVKDLLDSKQYEDVILLMDQILDKEQTSAYYFYRAYARNKITRHWDMNFKLILDDLNHAVAIDNDEDSLYLRFEVLNRYLQNIHSVLYGMQEAQSGIKDITENGDIVYVSESELPGWTTNEINEINNYKSLKDESIDKLIQLYPKAWYYCMKYDWYTKDRLKNIEMACELDPQFWYFDRKADTEIEEGLYERALNSVLQAKELNQGSINTALAYKHARLLIILGDNDSVAPIIKELVHIKDGNGLYPDRPVLLTKGQTWVQGYYGIELLYMAGKIEEYAKLLSGYFRDNPKWVDSHLICKLIEGDHHDIFLKYFNYNEFKTQVILFMNICAYLGKKETSEANALIKKLNGELLYNECIKINLTPIVQEEKPKTTRIYIPSSGMLLYGAYDDIDVLFSLIRFDRLGVNTFVDIVVALFHDHNFYEIYDIYEICLSNFNLNNSKTADTVNWNKSDNESMYVIRRMKIMLAFLHDLPYHGTNDPAKTRLLQNRFELALSKNLVIDSERIEYNAREAERKEMMNRLAHNIKGIISSISFPLERMKREVPEKARKLDEAIRGSNLIREMVNTINYSYNTKIDHIKYDILHAGKDSGSIYDMLLTSLRDSITNVLYDKHFSQYRDQYFVSSETHNKAIEEWETIFTDPTWVAIDSFARKHLFALECNIDNAKQYKVGNDMGSYLKLSMMFLEIVLNAVKYSAYVPKMDRKVSISFCLSESHLIFNVSNRFNPDIKAISTGIGHFIIKNYSLVLDCKPDIHIENEIYSLTMKFHNYWR